MSAVRLRAVEEADVEAIARIYTHHWCNYVPDPADKLLCGTLITYGCLVRSPAAIVAERDGEVLGCCLGALAPEGRAVTVERWRAPFEEYRARGVERAKTADRRLEGALFGDLREFETADSFMRAGSVYGQAEVNLIMVDRGLQGQGIGGLMFDRTLELFREGGAGGFFLMTDSSSDYAWYERRGMTRLLEKRDDPDDPSWASFVYGALL